MEKLGTEKTPFKIWKYKIENFKIEFELCFLFKFEGGSTFLSQSLPLFLYNL